MAMFPIRRTRRPFDSGRCARAASARRSCWRGTRRPASFSARRRARRVRWSLTPAGTGRTVEEMSPCLKW